MREFLILDAIYVDNKLTWLWVSITDTHLKRNRDIYEAGGFAAMTAASSTNTHVDQNSPPDGTIEIETDLEILKILNKALDE